MVRWSPRFFSECTGTVTSLTTDGAEKRGRIPGGHAKNVVLISRAGGIRPCGLDEFNK